MTRFLILFMPLLLATPTMAQQALSSLPGIYGSATDPDQSCAANPHRLELMASPPHAILNWMKPAPDPRGGVTTEMVFDLLGADDHSLTLRLEGETRPATDGGPAIWTLRQTDEGYCWARPDWPVMRCEDAQIRCDAAAPSS